MNIRKTGIFSTREILKSGRVIFTQGNANYIIDIYKVLNEIENMNAKNRKIQKYSNMEYVVFIVNISL